MKHQIQSGSKKQKKEMADKAQKMESDMLERHRQELAVLAPADNSNGPTDCTAPTASVTESIPTTITNEPNGKVSRAHKKRVRAQHANCPNVRTGSEGSRRTTCHRANTSRRSDGSHATESSMFPLSYDAHDGMIADRNECGARQMRAHAAPTRSA